MAVINYSSYAQAIEKGMSKRNMTGMAKVLFAFMCAGNTEINAEAPSYLEEHVLTE